jgi:methyl-accepting chemotaxis protein
MSRNILFVIIVIASLALFAVIKRIIFKRSIVLNGTNPITISNVAIVTIAYVVGSTGLVHAFWGVPCVLGSILLSYIGLKRYLNKPLASINHSIAEFSEGNLSCCTNVNYTKEDEIGDIFRSLQSYQQSIGDIIEKVHSVSSTISDTGDELTKNSVSLTQMSNEQAASTEEISSSVEEMSSIVWQSSENADQTFKIVENTSHKLQIINESSNESKKAIETISQKITIINDIAFQTNILALNAAVEAARAGEHGRGFAVVASEVRKLAENSKNASDEIQALTKKMVETTLKTNQLIMDLIPDMEKNSKLIQEISAASKEQNSGIDQINRSMQELNTTTQETVGIADRLSGRSNELTDQSNILKDAIAFFKY